WQQMRIDERAGIGHPPDGDQQCRTQDELDDSPKPLAVETGTEIGQWGDRCCRKRHQQSRGARKAKPSSQVASNGRASARPSPRGRSKPSISLAFSPPSRAAPGGAQPAYGRWPALRLPIKNAISRRVCPLQMFIYICQYVTLEQIVCNID